MSDFENNKKKILIVDDFKATLVMLRKALQKKDYQILEASNGEEALRKFHEDNPDIVLMDIQMPVMDGLTACKHIKALPPDKQSPVLVFTGEDDEKSVEKAFEAGADDFINKPVNWVELNHRVKRLLKLNEMEDTIYYQSNYDRLTGLPNRFLMQDRIALTIQQFEHDNEMLALLQVNIKGFKAINDAFGYDQGDIFLQVIADRIKALKSSRDTLARVGGDRFALLIPNINSIKDLAQLTEHLINKITERCDLKNHEVIPICHIGVAIYPNDADTAQDLLAKAETAMGLAKEEPGNTIRFYNIKMNTRALEKLSLVSSAYLALEKKEYLAYYQPIIGLESGNIESAELLLRWQKPGQGLVSPANFIPLLEETGLILPVGQWVIEEACRLARYLKDIGHSDISIGVNLSALQFSQESLFDTVSTAILKNELNPSQIKLEITESIALKDIDHTVKLINAFREMGVKISMDDFGTGYSSLSAVKDIPLDELKIDMSFIRNIVENPMQRVIVETIIALGKGLKISLVAEGVETEEQKRLLQDMKCNQAQGYLFSKPVPAEDFKKMLK